MKSTAIQTPTKLTSFCRLSAMWIGLATLVGFGTSISRAGFHAWDINEIYSSPDGKVQFIELRALAAGQQFMNGTVTILATNSTVTNIFVCNSNLPADTGGRHCIIGTTNLASTPGGVTPDYVIPPNFIPQANTPGAAAVVFVPSFFPGNVVATVYTNLPMDGDSAIVRSGPGFVVAPTNSPLNFNLQANVIVPVKILTANKTDTNFLISFRTATGANNSTGPNYAVEATGTLPPTSWSVATNRTGNGTTQTVAIPLAAGTNQFFRLRVP